MLFLLPLALAGNYEDAQGKLVANKCDEALPLFDKALHKEPGDARAAVGRALCLAMDKRDDEAISELRALVDPGRRVIVEGAKHSLQGLKGDEKTYTERQFGDALTLLIDRKYTADASEILHNAERMAGASPSRIMAQALVEKAVDGQAAGWTWLAAQVKGHEEEPEMVAALGRHIRKDGAGVPAELEAVVLHHGDATTLYELIAGLYNGKEYSRCLADVEEVGDRLPEAPLFGYRCALLAPDVDKIAVYRTKLGANLPPGEAVLDATLAVQRADYTTAESVLATAIPHTETEMARFANVRATMYTKQGRWDEARTAVATKGVDMKVVTSLAVALARAGRRAEGQALLAEKCPTIADPTGRAACIAMVP